MSVNGRSCVAITCDYLLNVLCEWFAYVVDSNEELAGYNVFLEGPKKIV